MTDRKQLIAWLSDAHAMERATIDNIERLEKRMRKYPIFVDQYRSHLAESKDQLQRVEQMLRDLDSDPSFFKDSVTRVSGLAEAYAAAVSDDEPLKHCLAAFAYENFEISSYLSLIAAAEYLGEPEIAALCTRSFKEEEAMSNWLRNYIPKITVEFLANN
jgi:ferritin-like metal-binding protein YciE